MLPIDEASQRAFAAATRVMRESVLGLVDAHHHKPITPAVRSLAMADIAKEPSLTLDDGWGAELIKNFALWGAIQINGLIEGAAGVAELYGSERGFVLSPYVLVRFTAECAGRARWLFDPQISTQDRVIRSLNLKIDDFSYRKRLLGSEIRAEMNRRLREIREAAKDRGLDLTPRKKRGPQFIEPGLPTNTDFAKRGMSGSYGSILSGLASSATHGALTALLSHIIDAPSESELLETHAMVGSTSDQANMLLMAVGLALRDSINSEYEYYGHDSEEWLRAVNHLMKSGRRVIEAAGVQPPG